MSGVRTAIVVGNPKPASKTRDAARLLASGLAGARPDLEIDLIDLGPALFDWNNAQVKEAVAAVAGCSLLIVASPTFKATYTGLLKLFLDQFAGQTGMRGVVAIPLMLGAGDRHWLAADLLLKPVLVELGATCPAPGLYLNDKTYATGPELDQYVQVWKPTIDALLRLRGAA